MSNRLLDAIARKNDAIPPVWFMRQAGRYHAHYQNLRKKHDFMTLCKSPELACEVTLGPIEDFDFDAAILFSDILFPLEAMGMRLEFKPGPQFEKLIDNTQDVSALRSVDSVSFLAFQAEALSQIRRRLPKEKALIGFVGAPLTLYAYALEGTHKQLTKSREGFQNGLWSAFQEKLLPLLAANMKLQAESGAEVIALFDSAAGLFESSGGIPDEVVQNLKTLLDDFHAHFPKTPVIYYAKGVTNSYWLRLRGLRFDVLGVDWLHSISSLLKEPPGPWALQGNFQPEKMLLPDELFEQEISAYFQSLQALPQSARRGWISGLGHGILPATPESHVRRFIELHRASFSGSSRGATDVSNGAI